MSNKWILFFLIMVVSSSSVYAKKTQAKNYPDEFGNALKEKEYAFQLVPEFHKVLMKKGYAPGLNFNYIYWRYRNEIRRRPYNPFLDFCLGELYRYKDRYPDAFKFYDSAINKAGSDIYKNILLLELFSEKRLLKWRIKEENRLLEVKRDLGALALPVLSKYFFFRAKRAAFVGSEDEVTKNIGISKDMDPFNPAIGFAYTQFLLLDKKFEFLDEFLATIHTLYIDFKARLFLIIFSYNFLFILSSIVLISLIIAYFIKYFTFIRAKLTVVIPRKGISVGMRDFIALILLLLPLIWLFPSIWSLLYMVVVPIPFLNKRERWIIQLWIFILLIVSVFGVFQTRAYTALDPEQRVDILDSLGKDRYKPALIDKCDSLIAISPEDFSNYFLKGLLLKRGGFFDDAEVSYKKAMTLAPDVYQIYNNYANILFWKGQIDSSIKYYELAISKSPKAAAPHYNLAQAYIRQLNFDKSSIQMKIASHLNFNLISNQTKNSMEKNNRFLIDLILPQEMEWKWFFSLKRDYNVFPWKYIGFNYNSFTVFLACIFFLYLIIPRLVRNAGNLCPICSSPISKGNSVLFDNKYVCYRCYKKLSRVHSLDMKERLKNKIAADAKTALSNLSILWGLFLPGLGHIYIGKLRKGALFLLAFSFFSSILLVGRLTKITFYLPLLKGTNVGLYTGIAIIVIIYLFSLLSLFATNAEGSQ